LPAVQTAREAARMAQCQNNIKQLALGCLEHESITKRFPTGGWGFSWTGDPDRGTDWRQPGGWMYNILPFIEQQALHDLGIGAPPNSQAQLDAGTRRIGTPFNQTNCPSRRRPIVYPFLASYTWWDWPTNMNSPSAGHTMVTRSDYAMCGGDYWTFAAWPHPVQNQFAGPATTLSPNGGYLYVDDPQQSDARYVMTTLNLSVAWPQGVLGPAKANGVSFAMSMIKAGDVTDGLSNTYLLGEKNLCPDAYDIADDSGDNAFAIEGFDYNNYRFANDYSKCFDGQGNPCTQWSGPGPFPDTPGDYTHCMCFGSAHYVGFNMAFCDGSVRVNNYSIDLVTHSHLCNRHDGQTIDARKF
jgi:prepilin-type processing-associated H-X9-DG protein